MIFPVAMRFGRSKFPAMDSGLMRANDLLDDPNYLAYRLDFSREIIAFLPVQREKIRQVNALKREYLDATRPLVEVPLPDIANAVRERRNALREKPIRFLFHTAFCASTFLSRCLDVEGLTVCLREPQLLLDAANAKRIQWRSSSTDLDYRQLPELALLLLQKHASETETLIIKPINSVNNIIPELMSLTGSPPSLLLFTDAKSFVLSTLRKGEGGKQTVRSMFDLIRCDFPHLSNLQLTHAIHMTDLRIAMTLWRLQLEQASAAAGSFVANKTMATLYSENIIDHPEEVLAAANEFMQLGITAKEIAAIAGSEMRFQDAKNQGEAFSKQRRDDQYAELMNYFGDDLKDGLEWLVRNNPGTNLTPTLDGALPLG